MGVATKTKVGEYDNSLNDRIESIRSQFSMQFPVSMDSETASYSYCYVSDVFDEYVIAKEGDQYFKVGFKEKGKDFTFAAKDKWKAMKLAYINEMDGHFTDTLIITELSGSYPEVPIYPDVDVKALVKGEEDPVFLTLPIGQANVTSGNRRHYDEAFLVEMEKQVRQNKPIGLMGHLPSDARGTAFPLEAVHWIGSLRIGELLLGKGFLPQGEPRDRLERYKATNKKIATSIDASADVIWDQKIDAYRVLADTLKLGQIDIAPADRAGVTSLAAVPILTQEMVDHNVEVSGIVPTKEIEMGKEEVIKDLTAADASALPEAVKSALTKSHLEEMRVNLGLPEGADVMAALTSLKAKGDTSDQEALKNRLTELVDSEDKGIKVKAVKNLVSQLVLASKPQSIQELETRYAEVVDSSVVKEALQEFLKETMGPNQTTPIPSKTGPVKGKYFNIPEVPEEE